MLSPWWLPKETPGMAFYNRELKGVRRSYRFTQGVRGQYFFPYASSLLPPDQLLAYNSL